MSGNFNEEILNERKKRLGLDKVDTKKIFDVILSVYKKHILEEPRDIKGYTIDIAMSDMYYYNRLGNLEELYKTWGDIYYIDFKNSGFLQMGVNEQGDLEGYDDIDFSDIEEFNEISNLSFSLKEMIQLCKDNDFRIRLYSNAREDDPTTIEIEPYYSYDDNEKTINTYIESTKN